MYLVFSQGSELDAQEASMVHKARSYFSADLLFTERHYREGEAEFSVQLTPRGEPPYLARLRLRPATEDDHRAADAAEIRGRATGMGALARRCGQVWEVDEGQGPERLLHTLCALLAATALGPVMPPDGSTLYGVRGARERAERAAG